MERGKRGNLRGVGNVRDIVYERLARAAAGWRLLRRRVGWLQWASVLLRDALGVMPPTQERGGRRRMFRRAKRSSGKFAERLDNRKLAC
ncbi:hypothetical protein APA04_28480 [Pseudomonas aeruginosa]|nr:hypothetical protein APA04_28480 [Pseudomonas aeruginosa]